MSFNYKNPVCKGSWQIGNNCKTCERCVETDPNKPKELPRSTVWVMDYGILGRILFATKEQALAINKTASTYVEPYEATVFGGKPDMTDAYNGAREEVEIWKKRALEAEAKLRRLDIQISDETINLMYEKMLTAPNPEQFSSKNWFMFGCLIGHNFLKEVINVDTN